MQKYIDGYLASIPKSEKEKTINHLKEILKSKYNIDEAELSSILKILTEERSVTTSQITISASDKPSDALNPFFQAVETDLLYLLATINSLDVAIESIKEVCTSTHRELMNELSELEKKIEEKETLINLPENTIIFTESFNNNQGLEFRNSETEILFEDHRVSEKIPTVDFFIDEDESYLSLKIDKKEDLLRDNENILARLKIVDYRGKPVTETNPKYALDKRAFSFFDLTTIQNQEIECDIDNFFEKAAYAKLKILLPKKRKMSEFKITSISKKPIELCGIYIEGTNVLKEPLPISKTISLSLTDLIDTLDGSIESDEFVFLIRQKNYTKEIEEVFPILEMIKNSKKIANEYKKEIKDFIYKFFFEERTK